MTGYSDIVLFAATFAAAALLQGCATPRRGGDAAPGLVAVGHDSRIDLRWPRAEEPGLIGYNVYRAPHEKGPFKKLNDTPHMPHVYSDFIGKNGKTYWYRVTRVRKPAPQEPVESAPSRVVSATTRAMTDDELLASVQEATFRYFWDWGHPVSGLARERNHAGDRVTTGGTGFGLMAIMVAAERGFVTREQAAARVLKIVAFLQDNADRFHGAWPHWLNGRTGKTRRFSKFDDGADIVETAFLMEGMLTVRQYFDRPNAVEREIRERITQLWREVEWNWFLRGAGGKKLYWHWSPNYGFKKRLAIGGRFNECLIVYLLAIASPTHAIPASCYYEGWAGGEHYANGNTYFGIQQPVGNPMGGPLFFTHYSFIGFDPRGWRDRFCNYFENNRAITRINRAYCIANPKGFKGYSALVWGLTASDTPGGYQAHAPGRKDNGTIAPTAALSAMPYTPKESMATLKHFYHAYGDRLWGEFGFHDAFNLSEGWFAKSYLAIDQGPIVCMIENYRTGLCWRMFMANPEIEPALVAAGWRREPAP